MKIYPLETLGKLTQTFRNDGKSIVMCHGCFDMLHIGHVRHFNEARKHGDILVVTISSDRFVNKGKNRPVFNHSNRAEMIAALSCVDFVTISDFQDASTAISILKPNYYAKGIDYADKGVLLHERNAIKNNGGKLVFTTSEKFSTTEIIERIRA